MKKLLPLVVVVAVLMLFSGVVGAVVLEEPLELEEGMMGITAIMDEPVSDVVGEGVDGEVKITAVEEDVVGRGIEGEVVITAVPEDGIAETGISEEAVYLTGTADDVRRNSESTNYLPYAGIAAALLLAAAFVAKRKKAATVR